jgi:alpha-beta hydrolase superfamily lysophospholipase
MERLAKTGFAAHGMDYRGHGQADGVRAHVDAFAEYVGDLEALLEHVRVRAEGKKIFVLGHSLGGLIVAQWALGKKDTVAGVILCSPFMGLAFEPPQAKLLAAKVLERLAPRLHLGNELNVDELTHDPEIRRATKADPLYQHVTTAGWFRAVSGAQQDSLRRAGELTLPCLVLLGEADPIALPAAGRRLFGAIGATDKTLKTYEGFFHEILNETEREKVFQDLIGWLHGHL